MRISLCLLQPTKIKDFYDFLRPILGGCSCVAMHFLIFHFHFTFYIFKWFSNCVPRGNSRDLASTKQQPKG